jgi:hypothetical protein
MVTLEQSNIIVFKINIPLSFVRIILIYHLLVGLTIVVVTFF